MENDLEMRGKLQEIYTMTRENNAMLTRMRRNQRIDSVFRVVYYLFVLGVLAGAYYYVQPYVDKLVGIYNQTTNASQSVQDFQKKFPGDISSFFEKLRGETKVEQLQK